jgi:hypothetical protein
VRRGHGSFDLARLENSSAGHGPPDATAKLRLKARG